MKKYWHTWTLFIQAWKYKWSFKYEHCIKCGKCDSKHKGRWLCTKCRDKERDKNKHRKSIKKQAWLKFYNKVKDTIKEKERKKKQAKKYYTKNQEYIKAMSRVYYRLSRGLPCLQILCDNWKYKKIPCDTLEKPNNYNNPNYKVEYTKWKENITYMDAIKKFNS